MTAHRGFLYLVTGVGAGIPDPRRKTQPRRLQLAHPRATICSLFLCRGKLGGPPIEPGPTDGRYAIRFPYYRRDDTTAQRIADALDATLRLVHGPTLDDHSVAVRFPRRLLSDGGILCCEDLIAFDRTQEDEDRIGEFTLGLILPDSCHVPALEMDYVFELLPTAVRSPYFEAIHFYRTAIDEFCFAGDDILHTLSDRDRCPTSQAESAKVEAAISNAFKAIEAIIGDPPRDERKLRRKLYNAGIDPDQLVGYRWPRDDSSADTVEPIVCKIRKMSECRDKRAAHRSRTDRNRRITCYELMDGQACARACLRITMEHARGAAEADPAALAE